MIKHLVISALLFLACILLAACNQKTEEPYSSGSSSEDSDYISSSFVEESSSHYENRNQEKMSEHSSIVLSSTVEPSETIAQSDASLEIESSHGSETIYYGRYIVTESIPESAVEYAQHMFSSFSYSELLGLGFTEKEAGSARLSSGIKIGGEDEYAYERYYFFVLSGNEVSALAIIFPLNDGSYSIQFGKNPLADAINTFSTTKQNPAKIIATENGFYSVDSTNGVQMLQQFDGSSVDGIEADKADFLARLNTITNTGNVVLIG